MRRRVAAMGVGVAAAAVAAVVVVLPGGIASAAGPQAAQVHAAPVAAWQWHPVKPKEAPAVRLAAAGPYALTVFWTPSRGATRYRLSWVDLDTNRSWTGSRPDYRLQNSPVTLTGLRRGALYRVTGPPD